MSIDPGYIYIFLCLFVSYEMSISRRERVTDGSRPVGFFPCIDAKVTPPTYSSKLFLFLLIPFDSFTPLYLLVSYDDDDQISFSNRICGDGGSNHLRWL